MRGVSIQNQTARPTRLFLVGLATIASALGLFFAASVVGPSPAAAQPGCASSILTNGCSGGGVLGGDPFDPFDIPSSNCDCIDLDPSPTFPIFEEPVDECFIGSNGSCSSGGDPAPTPSPVPAPQSDGATTFECHDWTFGSVCPEPAAPSTTTPIAPPTGDGPGLVCTDLTGPLPTCEEWRPAPGGTPTTPGTPTAPGTPATPTPGTPAAPTQTPPPPPPPVNPNPAITTAIAGLPLDPIVASDPDYATRNALVGVPTWFWLSSPDAVNNTATVNGVTVVATATVQSVNWDLGVDSRLCPGPGVPYQDPEPAGACTMTFDQSSAGEGSNNAFAGEATVEWEVQFQITGVPAAGITAVTVPNPQTDTSTANFELPVGEIQAIGS